MSLKNVLKNVLKQFLLFLLPLWGLFSLFLSFFLSSLSHLFQKNFRSDNGAQEGASSEEKVSLDDSLAESSDAITKYGNLGEEENTTTRTRSGTLEIKVWARGVARFRMSRLVQSLVDRYVSALNEFVLECFVLSAPIEVSSSSPSFPPPPTSPSVGEESLGLGTGGGESFERSKLGMVRKLLGRLEDLRADSVGSFQIHDNEAERLEIVCFVLFCFVFFF